MYYDYEIPDAIDELARRIEAFSPDPQYEHDRYVVASIKEAIEAAREGNFGVGAVIVDPNGEIVLGGHNHVFNPHFRSKRFKSELVLGACPVIRCCGLGISTTACGSTHTIVRPPFNTN